MKWPKPLQNTFIFCQPEWSSPRKWYSTYKRSLLWPLESELSCSYPRISRPWPCTEIASEVSSTLLLGAYQDIPSQCAVAGRLMAGTADLQKQLTHPPSYTSPLDRPPIQVSLGTHSSGRALSLSILTLTTHHRAKDREQKATRPSSSRTFWLLFSMPALCHAPGSRKDRVYLSQSVIDRCPECTFVPGQR